MAAFEHDRSRRHEKRSAGEFLDEPTWTLVRARALAIRDERYRRREIARRRRSALSEAFRPSLMAVATMLVYVAWAFCTVLLPAVICAIQNQRPRCRGRFGSRYITLKHAGGN